MLGDRVIPRMRGVLPLLFVLGCASPAAGEAERGYRQAIESIVSDAGVFIHHPMIDDPRLEYFFRRPNEFEAQARELIGDAHAAFHERRVALISMQCLPLPRYLDLLRFISRLEPTDENRILTHHAIVPGYQWSTRIVLGFKDASIRSALHDVLESPMADDSLKDSIGGVLSGALATYYRERNQRPSWQWQCSSALERVREARELLLQNPTLTKPLEELMELGTDGDPNVSVGAVSALGVVAGSHAGALAGKVVPYLEQRLKDGRQPVRRATAMALEEFGSYAVSAIPGLEDRIRQEPHTDVAAFAARALGAMGPAAAPAVDTLRWRLSYSRENPPWEVIKALGAIGKPARDSVPDLLDLLGTRDHSINGQINLALWLIAGHDSDVLSRVEADLSRMAATQEHVAARLVAANTIGEIAQHALPTPGLVRILRVTSEDPEDAVRQEAQFMLDRCRSVWGDQCGQFPGDETGR